MQTTTFDSTKKSLMSLLEGAARGDAQLPDFQRGWVWDDEHVRALLDEIAALMGKQLQHDPTEEWIGAEIEEEIYPPDSTVVI